MTSEEMEGDLRSDSEFILDDLEQMFISNYFAIPKELRNQRTVFASLMSSGLLYPIAILSRSQNDDQREFFRVKE